MCPTSSEHYQPDLAEIISLEEAAVLTGLSHGHLAHLIRKGLLWGKKFGRNWVTTQQAVTEYLDTNPKPGRKKEDN